MRERTRIFVLPPPRVDRHSPANEAPAPPPAVAPDRPEAQRPASRDDERDARGGLGVAGGASQYFGFVPLDGDLTASGRLQAVLAIPSESSRWLSLATLGLSGGIDVGRNRGVDAQIWRAGFVFALGAPWSRDVLGIAVEGGVLGGRYYDNNPLAIDHGSGRRIAGPYGESYGLRFYGLGRLTLQVPLKGDVRPFVAGELGATERPDGELSGIAGVTGGLAWNVW